MNGILHRSAEAVAQGKLQPTWATDEEGPLNTSPPREEMILRLRFGIGQRAGALEELSRQFSLTREPK